MTSQVLGDFFAPRFSLARKAPAFVGSTDLRAVTSSRTPPKEIIMKISSIFLSSSLSALFSAQYFFIRLGSFSSSFVFLCSNLEVARFMLHARYSSAEKLHRALRRRWLHGLTFKRTVTQSRSLMCMPSSLKHCASSYHAYLRQLR